MLEAKAKDQGHNAEVLSKKQVSAQTNRKFSTKFKSSPKKGLQIFLQGL